MRPFRIVWLYPNILSLHGDRGNLMALERVGKSMGLDIVIDRIEDPGDPVRFEQADLVFLNPGEFQSVRAIVRALLDEKEALDAYVESDGVIVAVGTTGAAFGKTVRPLDGAPFDGLGYVDMISTERSTIIGDDLIVRVIGTELEAAGSQITIHDAELMSGQPFGDVIYGYGNNGYARRQDGARYRNLICTNLLGPLLVKNPWLAENFIRAALLRRGEALPEPLPEAFFSLERKSYAGILDYCVRDYDRTKSGNPWNPDNIYG